MASISASDAREAGSRFRSMKGGRRDGVDVMCFVLVVLCAGGTAGCATLEKARQYEALRIENLSLQRRLAELERERLSMERDLRSAQDHLERGLRSEIGRDEAGVAMTRRGLVITFLDSVFFDSGKADLRESGRAKLAKVALVLKRDVPALEVVVEGHTDNQPIRYSGWTSNWELSTARALSVLHALIEEGVPPQRLSVAGYGEYRPVADNTTEEGRQRNRRVEIVILRPDNERSGNE